MGGLTGQFTDLYMLCAADHSACSGFAEARRKAFEGSFADFTGSQLEAIEEARKGGAVELLLSNERFSCWGVASGAVFGSVESPLRPRNLGSALARDGVCELNCNSDTAESFSRGQSEPGCGEVAARCARCLSWTLQGGRAGVP